ncbi:unnamed protein product [Prorocentrum cordatum]|uniref:Uncharacterized protein n=1 Tax=Prorocentrum cordatum TaxID=2364126 RepID=A0ABN9WSM8_9DINO|nr:unnamed protein product [Polarella glacialis]
MDLPQLDRLPAEQFACHRYHHPERRPDTLAAPDGSRANASRAEAVVGCNIAKAPGGSSMLLARLSEATSMVGTMDAQAAFTIQGSSLLAAPNTVLTDPGFAKSKKVGGISVVYVDIPVFSFSALPVDQGLEAMLLADF